MVQFIGAFCGLGIAYMLRVKVLSVADLTVLVYLPDVYPFFPQIIDATKRLPAYGQVFLTETLGVMFLSYFISLANSKSLVDVTSSL